MNEQPIENCHAAPFAAPRFLPLLVMCFAVHAQELTPSLYYGIQIAGQSNSLYRVESSTGINGPWETSGFVRLAGTNGIFIDNFPLSGHKFYRSVEVPDDQEAQQVATYIQPPNNRTLQLGGGSDHSSEIALINGPTWEYGYIRLHANGGDNAVIVRQLNFEQGQCAFSHQDYLGFEASAGGYGNDRPGNIFYHVDFREIGEVVPERRDKPTDWVIVITHEDPNYDGSKQYAPIRIRSTGEYEWRNKHNEPVVNGDAEGSFRFDRLLKVGNPAVTLQTRGIALENGLFIESVNASGEHARPMLGINKQNILEVGSRTPDFQKATEIYSGNNAPAIRATSDNVVSFTADIIRIGGPNGPAFASGFGSPEGRLELPKGSIYTDRSGGSGAVMWVKETEGGAAGWVGK